MRTHRQMGKTEIVFSIYVPENIHIESVLKKG